MNRQFEIGDLSPPKLFIGISVVLGLLFALITEPTGSLLAHLTQWQIQTTGAVLCVLATHLILFALLKTPMPTPWIGIAMSGVLGAVLFSPIALMSDIYLGAESLKSGFTTKLFDEMLAIVPPISIAWLAMNSPWLLGYRLWRSPKPASTTKKNDEATPVIVEKPEPAFLSLTDLSTAQEILYIKSELHYLSVVTAERKQLILCSLKEAIPQLEEVGVDGVQCHRGYWVAHSAIDTAHRSGRQAVFVLSNGDQIPISRANVSSCLALIEQ